MPAFALAMNPRLFCLLVKDLQLLLHIFGHWILDAEPYKAFQATLEFVLFDLVLQHDIVFAKSFAICSGELASLSPDHLEPVLPNH